jgi:hypothetical protein
LKADRTPIDGGLNADTKLDGRTRLGRRFRSLIRSLIADLGGSLTEAEATFVKLAAANLMRAEQITTAIGRGETIRDEDLVRISNAATRILKELRILKATRAPTGPTLADVVASYRPQPEPADDLDDGDGEIAE